MLKLDQTWPWQLKGFFDGGCSLILLMVLSPLFFLIAVLIKLDSPGPVFYRQKRVGKEGRIFYLWKFRSMVVNAEFMGAGYGFVKDDPRITRFGLFLRRYSLDELPQLFNVILGEMSLVGPRPALPHHLARYGDFEKKRLLVKPGVTGWAQINGRNEIPWSQRFALDAWYVDNWSLPMDLKILARTLSTVLRRQGVRMDQAPGEVLDF
jgi:undecaprenyl phosphate N,N'-diacetylbacillosamine 1-phosphate transferase